MFERLRRQAEDNWTKWATALADGGQPPEPLQLLEAGGLLGIAQPADALEKDANAIREVRDRDAQAAGLREQAATQREPHGTQAERRERIAALRAEIRKLEGLSGIHPFQVRAGEILGAAGRIRRKHPRAFRAPAPVVTKKTPSRKKEMAQ
jgi:hypothetical protein